MKKLLSAFMFAFLITFILALTEAAPAAASPEVVGAAGDSTVRINDNDAVHFVFDDSEWDCPVDVTWLGDGEYDLEAVVTDHNGSENDNLEGACYLDDKIHVDGGILANAGISWVKIAVKLSAEGIDDILSNEVELDVRGIYVERHFDVGDMSMLPGWDRFISRDYGCYVENADYPEGSHDYSLKVTDVAVSDETVVKIESSDENGWNLRAENTGNCKVTLTYKDWDDTTGHTYEFDIHVSDDVYGVDVRTDSGSRRVLREGSAAMTAQASHEQYNAQSGEYHTCTGDELAGITYDWTLNIHQDDARDQLGDVITVTQDVNDPGKAVVSFAGVPDDWHEGIDVEVLVSIKAGGEDVVAENNYWLRMDESYLEMWPTEIDGDIHVGETFTVTPEVRRYPGKNGQEYDVLPSEEVRFETEIYDDNAYEIAENGGTFTVLRKLEYGTSFRIKAFVNDEGEYREVDNREYWLNDMGYWISIRDEQGTGDLFNDGVWSCPIEVRGLDDAAYTLTAWAEQHNGPESADATGAVHTDTEKKRLYIDGAKLNEMGISWIKVVVSARVGGYEISDRSERDFGVREARIDRDLNLYDRSLLPGWTHWIDRKRNCHIENSKYPDGQDFELTVTDVAVSDEGVVNIENSDEYGWNLRAKNMGECTVTVSYTDWDGSGQTGAFKLYVGSDVYSVDMWTEDGSFKVLPGGTVTMYAQAGHEQYDLYTRDHHTCSDEEMSGIAYNWEAEVVDADKDTDLNGCITVTPDAADPRKAVISFNNIPEECSWANVKVIAAIEENGEETARTDRWIFMSREYRELWPTELYSDMDVGGMILFMPEVREYPADNEDGYNVLPSDQVRFETEIYDNSAYMLESFENGSLMLSRLREYRSSFRIKAFVINENGDWEYADDREYWLNEKNYDIRYDIEGNDTIYSDGERTFALDLSNLDTANYEIVPHVGTGEFGEDGFEHSLAEGEGWSYNDSTGEITFDGGALYNKDISRIETKISVMMGGMEVASEWHGFDVREVEIDRYFNFQDRNLLPGWDMWVDKYQNCHIRNNSYPDGMTYSLSVSSIATDNEDVAGIDSDDGDGWQIRAYALGTADVTVNYYDWDGTERTEVFTITVSTDEYWIDMETESGSDRVLPGRTVIMTAEPHHEQYDMDTGDYHTFSEEEMSGFTYTWGFEIPDAEAAAALGSSITITPDPDDPGRAVVSFENVPDGWNYAEVDITVSAAENNKIVAGSSRRLFMQDFYYDLWAAEVPGNLEVGEMEVIETELRLYSVDFENEYIPVSSERCRVEFDYHDVNAYDIYETADGILSLRRKRAYGTSYGLRAYLIDDRGNYEKVDYKEYWLDDLGYTVNVKTWEGTGDLFPDSTDEYEWSCPVDVLNMDNVDYEFEINVLDLDEGSWTQAADSCRVETQTDGTYRLCIDGEKLYNAGAGWIRARVIPVVHYDVDGETYGYPIENTGEFYMEVREPEAEYDFGVEGLVLVHGSLHWLDRIQTCHVENGEYPYGQDFSIPVQSINIWDEEGENVLNAVETDGGWNIEAANPGNATIEVVYTGWDESEESEQFAVRVTDDLYVLYLSTESGSDKVLRGKNVTMTAEVEHYTYDYETETIHRASGEEIEGLTYHWEIEIPDQAASNALSEIIKLTTSPAEPQKAIISFEGVSEEWTDVDVKVRAYIEANGDLCADRTYELHMKEEYLELWPMEFEKELRAGESTIFAPEIRRYSADDENEYTVVPAEETSFIPENIDSEVCVITDNNDGTFTVKKLANYFTSFRMRAFVKNESGDYDDVDMREYRLHVPEENGPAFMTQSLLLTGKLGLKFYLDLPVLEGVDYSESYMTFKLGSSEEEQRDDYDSNDKNASGQFFGFTCEVNAIEMADTITAVFHYGDGQTIEMTATVKEYLDLLQNSNYSDALKELAKAIADYGYYAQQFLAPLRGWTIGTDHTAMPVGTVYTDSDRSAVHDAVSGYGVVCNNANSGIAQASISLLLDSETSLNIYLKPAEEFTGTVTAHIGNGTENAAEPLSNGRYRVCISNISAHLLGNTYTVNVTAGESFTIEVSALSYVKLLMDNDSDINAQNMMAAIYHYYAKTAVYTGN